MLNSYTCLYYFFMKLKNNTSIILLNNIIWIIDPGYGNGSCKKKINIFLFFTCKGNQRFGKANLFHIILCILQHKEQNITDVKFLYKTSTVKKKKIGQNFSSLKIHLILLLLFFFLTIQVLVFFSSRWKHGVKLSVYRSQTTVNQSVSPRIEKREKTGVSFRFSDWRRSRVRVRSRRPCRSPREATGFLEVPSNIWF